LSDFAARPILRAFTLAGAYPCAGSSVDALAAIINSLIAKLREGMSVDYGIAYDNLLNAANTKLTRPLKDGFRMEGHLSSAKLEKVYLPVDGIVIALRASGDLKILYGT
jgi:hypothetical protein